MQTFLPHESFRKPLRCLDYRRLGKQRVEAHQILNILLNRTKTKGWRKHPAVLMWKDNPNSLKLYFNLCLDEWERRGYRNNMSREIIRGKVTFPAWIGDERFHASHRSNLLRKDYDYYSRFKWKEENNLPYVWPL